VTCEGLCAVVMSCVRVSVRAANAEPTDPDVEVDLPVGPGEWGREHTERVANAVGVDTHGVFVSLRFAAGAEVPLPPGEPGWRMLGVMSSSDVLVVSPGAAAAASFAVSPSPSVGSSPKRTHSGPAEGVPLPEEEQNSKRLNMLFLSGPAEVRKALQQVRTRALLSLAELVCDAPLEVDSCPTLTRDSHTRVTCTCLHTTPHHLTPHRNHNHNHTMPRTTYRKAFCAAVGHYVPRPPVGRR
jgi:hypothetical protein